MRGTRNRKLYAIMCVGIGKGKCTLSCVWDLEWESVRYLVRGNRNRKLYAIMCVGLHVGIGNCTLSCACDYM